MDMTRRQFLAFLTAGGIMTADELWLPGRKLISIPNRPIVTRAEIELLDKLRASYDGGRSFFKVPVHYVTEQSGVFFAGPRDKITIQHPITQAWIHVSEFGNL